MFLNDDSLLQIFLRLPVKRLASVRATSKRFKTLAEYTLKYYVGRARIELKDGNDSFQPSALTFLAKYCPNLKSLHFSWEVELDGHIFRHSFHRVETLNIQGDYNTLPTSHMVSLVDNLKFLRSLTLGGIRTTESGLHYLLTQCLTLKCLKLEYSNLTGKCFDQAKVQLKRLILISCCRLQDECFDFIAETQRSSLEFLQMVCCPKKFNERIAGVFPKLKFLRYENPTENIQSPKLEVQPELTELSLHAQELTGVGSSLVSSKITSLTKLKLQFATMNDNQLAYILRHVPFLVDLVILVEDMDHNRQETLLQITELRALKRLIFYQEESDIDFDWIRLLEKQVNLLDLRVGIMNKQFAEHIFEHVRRTSCVSKWLNLTLVHSCYGVACTSRKRVERNIDLLSICVDQLLDPAGFEKFEMDNGCFQINEDGFYESRDAFSLFEIIASWTLTKTLQ